MTVRSSLILVSVICMSALSQSTDVSVEEIYTDDTLGPVIQTTSVTQSAVTPPHVGAIHITAMPSSGQIFVDGKRAGIGMCTVENLAIGPHTVTVCTEDDCVDQTVLVVEGRLRPVAISTDRVVRGEITTSFSQVWSHAIGAFGPSLDLGLRIRNNYVGINYQWDFFSRDMFSSSENTSAWMLGGAALQYYHIFSASRVLEVGVGGAGGFWFFDGYKYDATDYDPYYYNYSNGQSYEELFFGGPSVRIYIGSKYVAFSTTGTLLLGSNVAFLLYIGLTARP